MTKFINTQITLEIILENIASYYSVPIPTYTISPILYIMYYD